MAQVKCPHCNSNNVAKTIKGRVAKGAASFGGGFVEGVIKEVANGLLFDGAGRFIPKFGESLASLAPVEYVCQECDCLFSTLISADGDVGKKTIKKYPMPKEIIEKEREAYVSILRKKRPFISMAIFAFLTFYCLVYMFFGNGFQSFCSFIFAILVIIPTILKWREISSLNQQIEECEMQSPRDFKNLHKELFRKYSQYN